MQHKISICTTCMDRQFYLMQTLPANVAGDKDYPNVEFVVMDYNSKVRDIWPWLQGTFPAELESGRIVYYRTEEPTYFSMAHSRNLAFRLATGAIVNNVDADSFTKENFCQKLNELAAAHPRRAIFAKSNRLMRGRIGFYRDEFIDLLGGYDEDFEGYGYDDHDLRARALLQGFTLLKYKGEYVERIPTPNPLKGANMRNPNWHDTQKANRRLSEKKLAEGIFKANEGKHWGAGRVVRNNSEEIVL